MTSNMPLNLPFLASRDKAPAYWMYNIRGCLSRRAIKPAAAFL